MKNCNSTITTFEVGDRCKNEYCSHQRCIGVTDPDDHRCFNWHVLKKKVFTCKVHDEYANFPHHSENIAWTDETPGAKPHTPPLVSEQELQQAIWGYAASRGGNRPYKVSMHETEALRAGLKAAARYRKKKKNA